MTHIIADRVLETSTTTGTGNFSLAGAVVGFRDFDSVMANGDTCYYHIEAVDAAGLPTGEWETGFGTFNDTDTLVRTTVIASSNAGAAVSFSAGTKRVALSLLARQLGEGSAFPSSPRTGERFFRTDRGIEYYYDGTRWLSTQPHEIHLGPYRGDDVITVTTGRYLYAANPFWNKYDFYIEDIVTVTLLSATAVWSMDVYKQDGTVATLLGQRSTSGDAASDFIGHRNNIATVVASTVEAYQCNAVKTSGGNLTGMITLYGYLVG